MFDIGFSELLVCAVIALLVLGPERLPQAARTAGRWVGKARRMVQQMSEEIDRQIKAEELRERLKDETQSLGLDQVQDSVRSALKETEAFNAVIMPPEEEEKTTSDNKPVSDRPQKAPETETLSAASDQPADSPEGKSHQ